MRGRSLQPIRPRPAPPPRVTDEVRKAVDTQATVVINELKKRSRKPHDNSEINWAEDLFTRWHRNPLYFVVVLRTPQGYTPTIETRAARMEHAGDGKFNFAVPMRSGWNTFMRNASPEECLAEFSQSFYY